jgi:outer membrane protein TolC
MYMQRMIIKIGVIFWILIINDFAVSADSLDLYTCFKSAELLSPLKKQEAMIQTVQELNLRNISTNYLPEFTLSGKATYQSDVITIPGTGKIPDYPTIPKDQYLVSLNLRQNIFDAGASHHQRSLEDARTSVAEDQLSTELFNQKEVINQLFFSVILIQENIKTLKISRETLLSQQKIMKARVQDGTVLPSILFNIDKELLSLEQRIRQLEYDKKTSTTLLSIWIGRDLSEEDQFIIPDIAEVSLPPLKRPELELFTSQQELLESTKAMTHSKELPSLYAFAQGGYGSPNPYDIFKTNFTNYYMLGLQLNWKPFNWGNNNRERQTLQVQMEQIETRRTDFERNISMSLQKEMNESAKLKEMISMDSEIVSIQKKVVEQYFSQLQNGVITPTEYLAEFNALTNAELNRQIHTILLSQVAVNILITSGNID